MIQRLLMFGTVFLALAGPPAFGLGLGKLDLQSALNQQFVAEIELTNSAGLAVEEILPNLASQLDFDRVGVERAYQLTDLRFKVVSLDNGRKILRVTSTRPVTEPFLNFLVEVLWPSGRILREYTVLLDPPVFTEDGVAPLQAASVVRSEVSAAPAPRAVAAAPVAQPATPSAAPVAARATQVPAQAAAMQEGNVNDGEYGVTGAGDTLWKIAMRVRPTDAVTVQQTMLALQRANPNAFINNNINLLKAGYVLRIPEGREIQRDSAANALNEVQTQNDQFDAYRSGQPMTQLDASARQRDGNERPVDDDSGELKLLAAEDRSAGAGDRAGAGASAGASGALQENLALAREDLDRTNRANSELTVRLDDLAGQIETLNEIVKLKDDQLAALRAEIQKTQGAEATPAVTTTTAPSANSGLLANPFVLGGLGLLLIGAVAGGLIYRKRRQDQNEFDEDDYEQGGLEDSPLAEEAPAAEKALAPKDDDYDEDVSPETSDVIGEVEIYIAYGRFPQAINFLQKAIQAEPERTDLRLKLLEVYVQTEDGVAFNLQLEQLRPMADAATLKQALALQAKIPGAAENAAAAMGATVISHEPITPVSAADDDDDDLSFDLDDLDSDLESEALGSDFDFDSSDDLDLDLDDGEEQDINLASTVEIDADSPVALAGDDLEDDFDLDLDLDLDLDGESLDLGEELKLDDDEFELDGDALTLDDDELSLDDDELALDDDELPLDDDELPLDDDELKLDDDELKLDDDELTLEDGLALDDDELSLEDDAFDLDDVSVALDDTAVTETPVLSLEEDSLELVEDDLLGLDDDDVLSLDDDALALDDDGSFSLDLDDDDGAFTLDEDDLDDTFSLDLDSELDGELNAELDDDDLDDDSFSLDLDDVADAESKLNLARSLIQMDDMDGARLALEEVLLIGSDAEIDEAQALLEQVS